MNLDGLKGVSVMKILMIINDAPYGSEHMYNGLRLGGSLAKHEGTELKVFLIGDAVSGAHKGQKVPQGYYNVQTMLNAVIRRNASVGVCGSCMDARGMTDTELVEGAHRSSMEELTSWTLEADKVISF
jgi:uncharacterized protein involved in oxidation of intracellular sulfur